MIGLDTNVVLRLMVQDDPTQLRRARRAVAGRCSEEEPGLINRIVLVEVIWVLSRGYKYSREEIVSAVEKLLQVKELAVQNPGEVWEALHLYRDSKVGFADLYIAVLNRQEGYSPTLTFDKKAARTDLFELV